MQVSNTYKIYAEITRIYDEKTMEYFLLRNNTKIIFGTGEKYLGTVIMTNPGSFEFKELRTWESFTRGEGNDDTFQGTTTKADPTMINIIKAIHEGYSKSGETIPNGYVRIYNLSSVRCSKGEKAEAVHYKAKALLQAQGKAMDLLEEPIVYNKEKNMQMIEDSPFIIMGFLKNVLTQEANRLRNWSKMNKQCSEKEWANGKGVATLGIDGCLLHPIVWIKIGQGKGFKEIVDRLHHLTSSNNSSSTFIH